MQKWLNVYGFMIRQKEKISLNYILNLFQKYKNCSENGSKISPHIFMYLSYLKTKKYVPLFNWFSIAVEKNLIKSDWSKIEKNITESLF